MARKRRKTQFSEQLPLPLGPIRNSNLFSSHWLEHRLPLEPEWTELRQDAEAILDRLGDLWQREQNRVQQYSEGGLEQAFIQQVFEELGWKLIYQTHLRGRKPDYALFLEESAKDAALALDRTDQHFWDHTAVVADAKAWMVNLDRPIKIEGKKEYPPEQIEWYIHHSVRDYGILTNGRHWRLYPRALSAHQARFETYIECDLAAILDDWITPSGSVAQHEAALLDFLRFYLFFSPVAFLSVQGRKPPIARAAEGSNEYRLGIGEGLKDRVFEALSICIEGFLTHNPNRLDPGKDMATCKEQSLILLYRLLFIMYGEDRGLLPYRVNRTYTYNRSLGRLRDEIAGEIDKVNFGTGQDFERNATNLWGHLSNLFDLIDKGHKTYGVPPYNGGLFDPDESAFLRDNALPDWYLARVIDQLGRAPDSEHPDAGLFRVDYRDLSIQHLGHVYEGLLELHPHCAAEPMMVVRKAARQKVQERVVACSAVLPSGFEPTPTRYEKGEVYLVTDKGERRATGSYYTPNHIVDYIVEKTLRPLCRHIGETLVAEIEKTGQEAKRRRGRHRAFLRDKLTKLHGDFDDRVLQLRVLDPAMGSGHFLLRACQCLAEEIATSPYTSDPHTDRLEDDESILTYWKRRIVEHCLYGVDFNPLAVELAKVALWLETASRNEPLTFLDHHLRHGNSLVGGWVGDLGALPGAPPMPLFEQQASSRLPILLDGLKQISDTRSQTADQVKEKTKLYRQAVEKVREPLRNVADLWCATYYLDSGDQLTPEQYSDAIQTLGTPRKHATLLKKPRFTKALATARRGDVACFHWELEFPEVFFDKSGRREEAGFDVVIGNPPYDVLSEKETGHDLAALKKFLKARSIYGPSFRGKNNLYKLFVCLALHLLRNGGHMGFITPMPVLGDYQAAEIRKRILQVGAFTSVDAFPQKDDPSKRVFPEAKLSTAVFTLIKTENDTLKAFPFVSHVHPAQYIEANSPSLTLTAADIPLYDPANLTIVSCSQEDWDLAVRMMRKGRVDRLGTFAQGFQGEVNETNDRNAGRISYVAKDGPEALRGAHLCLYTMRSASQGTAIYVRVDDFLARASADSKAFHHRHARVGFQRKSPQNNFRRLIAAPVARGTFLVESISYVPEHLCSVPLEIVLALLNSKLCDWYFRLGSTNAMVGEYQVKNLPCPVFGNEKEGSDKKMREAALAAIRQGDMDKAFDALTAGLAQPPFSPAVRDTIVALVRRIVQAEEQRGEISRTDRSALCTAAQPHQDLIDRLLYAMAGLSDAEAKGLEERLAEML